MKTLEKMCSICSTKPVVISGLYNIALSHNASETHSNVIIAGFCTVHTNVSTDNYLLKSSIVWS